jgi:predicted transcriptional regulator of viral defense system
MGGLQVRYFMTKKTFAFAKKVFREHHGLLRTSQAKRLGIDEPVVQQMYQEGMLVKEAQGLYRLAESPPLSNPDWVQIAIRVPKAVICLTSALNFHNLTTQIPHKIYIALPRQTKAPRIEYPPLDITYLSEIPYQAGIEDHQIDGVTARIYNREKTIADCFKFRRKIGLDIALEALRDYMRQPERNVPSLMYFAKINRVSRIMEPYLQALQ